MLGILGGIFYFLWMAVVWVFYIVVYLLALIFGLIWVGIFSTILFLVNFAGMCVFYTFFSLLWLADRTTLLINSISGRCGECKKISVVPLFDCPNPTCGFKHKKLTPGPYGIFYRKCSCGTRAPSTVFNGRTSLKASCQCGNDLATGGARHFGIQLVGASSSGKTTFLAAFWHLYFEQIKKSKKKTLERFPADAFERLEDWYQHGEIESTSDFNASMYSVVHKHGKKVPYQLTVYDIAGEAFTQGSNTQQQQFKYCETIVFVIDPTASPNDASETFSSFVNEFKGLKGKHSTKMSDIPIVIAISKADKFKHEIGQSNLGTIGNEVCRKFLSDRNFGNLLNLFDGEFKRAQYFFVSAMGHEAISGRPYEPWGIKEVAVWILKHSGSLKRKQGVIRGLKHVFALVIFGAFVASASFGLYNGWVFLRDNVQITLPTLPARTRVPVPAQIQTPTPAPVFAVVTVSTLNVRRTPSAVNDANIIEAIPLNTRVEILARATGAWVRIRYGNGRIGYVNSNFLRMLQPTHATVTVSGLNVRRTPSAVNDANIIETIPLNTRVEILERVGGTWVRIRYSNGRIGYVNSNFLSY